MLSDQPSRLEAMMNAPLTPYLFGFFGWYAMWLIQLQLTAFDYALGVSLIFLPAGIRTLAVLILAFVVLLAYFWARFCRRLAIWVISRQ